MPAHSAQSFFGLGSSAIAVGATVAHSEEYTSFPRMEIRTDDGGSPSDEVLAWAEEECGTFGWDWDSSHFPEWECFAFDDSVKLDEGTKYWLVLRAAADATEPQPTFWSGNFSEDVETDYDPFPEGDPLVSDDGCLNWVTFSYAFVGDFTFKIFDE